MKKNRTIEVENESMSNPPTIPKEEAQMEERSYMEEEKRIGEEQS